MTRVRPVVALRPCPATGKQIHDSRASAEARLADMQRRNRRNGQPAYRGEPFPCGDHWHIGRRFKGVCGECRANLARYDHKLDCSKGGHRS